MGNKIPIESISPIRRETPDINIEEKPYFDRVNHGVQNF